MRLTYKSSLTCMVLLALVAGSAAALVHQRNDSPLADRQFTAAELEAHAILSRADDLPQPWRTPALAALQDLGVGRDHGLFDRRSARWGTLMPSQPMIPGRGVGNSLTWEGLGVVPQSDDAIRDAAWSALSAYLAQNAAGLRIDLAELDVRSGVFNGGEIVQFFSGRTHAGMPVRNAAFSAVINHGNLTLMGVEAWGDIRIDTTPKVSADDAIVAVGRFVAPLAISGLRQQPTLEIAPVGAGDEFAIGAGYDHRLVWAVKADVEGAFGQWEALVDAGNGRILEFQDRNHYGTDRNVNGGHYPITYDGIDPDGVMQDSYPMPFADLSSGGFTDSGGNFTAVGSVTTTLSGQFVRIADQCPGVFSESSSGDIELGGTHGDVDCDTPTSGDNTASARSGFYEVNRIKEQARGQLPANVWLTQQLTANMNINQSCNAFWNGSTINFYREGFPCGNTGQIGSVFDHEWGHGMDDNDINGQVIATANGGGEGIADVYASLRLDTSCVGRGFFIDGSLCGGYGDPCTPASGCTGIRDIDWEHRNSGVPHGVTFVQTCGCCSSTHCRGAIYAEAIWDLLKRDLPTLFGMSNNTALEVTTRLTYIGGGILNGWYPPLGPVDSNCGATFGYMNFLAADDDNGSLADGTPHMTAIAQAFERHEIGCSTGPTVQNSGCVGTPTTAPAVTAVSTNQGANLSWGAVGGASSYNVYRTDGVFACDFGKELVASTAGTVFADSGLKNNHPYHYTVIPMGPAATCFGPASDCDSVGGGTIFADGFESGNTSAWSMTVP